MIHAYNFILILALILFSPILVFKLLTDRRYRIGISERLGILPAELMTEIGRKQTIWIHAASVGEVTASLGLIEQIKKGFPGQSLLLTTFTAAGKETGISRSRADHVFLLPADIPTVIKRTLQSVKPVILILIETEIWPNLISRAGGMDIPILIVNGRISDRSFPRYRFLKPFLTKILKNVKFFLMQSKMDSERITELGADPARIIITGNIKFDQEVRNVRLPFMELWKGTVMAGGSTHRGEESVLLDIFMKLRVSYPELKMVLAPRHIERLEEVEQILIDKGLSFARFSRADKDITVPVLIVDTLGDLSSIYRYCDVVFVGGSLVPIGGHNILEPAAYSKPVLFGPHMENFRDAAQILKLAGGGMEVGNLAELQEQLHFLLSDRNVRANMGQKAFDAYMSNRGALDKSLNIISEVIKGTDKRRKRVIYQ